MITRRAMLKAGIGAALPALSLTRPAAVLAGPFPAELRSVPLDKKLSREWLDRLSERGTARVYRTWDEQRYVGMPIGGIGAGTVYLGGDGKLWCWDIFNQAHEGVVPSTLKPGKHTNLRGGRLRERDWPISSNLRHRQTAPGDLNRDSRWLSAGTARRQDFRWTIPVSAISPSPVPPPRRMFATDPARTVSRSILRP